MVKNSFITKGICISILSSQLSGCVPDPSIIQSKSEWLVNFSMGQVEKYTERETESFQRYNWKWNDYENIAKSKVAEAQLRLEYLEKLRISFDTLYQEMVARHGEIKVTGNEATHGAIATPDSALFRNARDLLSSMKFSGSIKFERNAHPLLLWKAVLQNIRYELLKAYEKEDQKAWEQVDPPANKLPIFFLTRTASHSKGDSIEVILAQYDVIDAKSVYETPLVYISPPGKNYSLKDGIADVRFNYRIPAGKKTDTLKIISTFNVRDSVFKMQHKFTVKY